MGKVTSVNADLEATSVMEKLHEQGAVLWRDKQDCSLQSPIEAVSLRFRVLTMSKSAGNKIVKVLKAFVPEIELGKESFDQVTQVLPFSV
jgi:aspartate oxidase